MANPRRNAKERQKESIRYKNLRVTFGLPSMALLSVRNDCCREIPFVRSMKLEVYMLNETLPTMTKEQIQQAFEGRWRIKGHVFSAEDHVQGEIKALCRDFFEAGAVIGYDAKKIVTEATEIRPSKHDEIQIVDIERIPQMLGENDGFDKWWDMYGKKIDRTKCLNKWKKLTAKEQFDCIKATPAYVASTPDLQFRRHPMTYLNNKSWENQIIPHNNGTDNKSTLEQQRKSKLADILTD